MTILIGGECYQVSPNVMCLLHWGLGPSLHANSVKPTTIIFHWYDIGMQVGYTCWGGHMAHDHSASYYHIHHMDYHAILHSLVCSTPCMHICLGAAIRGIQPNPSIIGGPSVTLASGKVLYADLIVSGDSVKSMLQKAVMGLNDRATPMGDTAYCTVICTNLMLEDPELCLFVGTPEMTTWMVLGHNLMAYCIVSHDHDQ